MTIVADLRQQKSTIVRSKKASPVVRATFRLLDVAAPELGARRAERIWFTLPAAGDAGRPPAPPAPAQRFRLDVDGHAVAGTVWGHGPAVYLVHGWAGHAGQLTAFVPPLVARGYRVVAFDAPSHGASAPGRYGPRSSSVPEFATALTAVVSAQGPARAIIAHSLGATATAAALCDGLTADRVVLVAPMASPVWYARQLAAALGFGARTYRRLIERVERRVGAPMHHFDVPELGRAVAMPPTLVVHDRDDAHTPVADGAAVAAAWSGARLRVTSGLGHRRLLRDPDVVAEVVAFVGG